MSNQYDIIIIGAGLNGLVCANILAKKGRKVLVLEANKQVGGLANTREFASGFKVSAGAHLLYGLHPDIYRLCDVQESKIEFADKNISTLVINQNKEFINYSSGEDSQIIYSSSLSEQQNSDWSNFQNRMKTFSDILFDLANKTPPRLKNGSIQDYKTLFNTGLKLKRLDKQNLRQFLRIIGMNIYDLADESFTDNLQKAAICFESALGTRLGPRAPNTVYNWLNRYSIINRQPAGLSVPRGGIGSLSQAFANAALIKGVDISVSSRVEKILIADNQVKGVQLSGGEKFAARQVISNADIKKTMLSMVGPENIDTDVVRRVSYIPMQGTTAKMHLALNQLLEPITHNVSDFQSRIIYAPDADFIERASNSIKYNQYTHEPTFEITFPSVQDSSLAPAGKHVMSVLIPYVPYEHKEGWAQRKERFENHIIEQLEYIFPGIHAAIEHVETLTPADIERQFNITGGHWHHGEIGLERFMMLRPTAGFAQYKTPIDGLFLCGADCHPGGDLSGAPGMNAANTVLQSK